LACKQELVKTVSLGPVTQSLQREFDQLNQENKRLRDEVERWRAFAARLQTATNPAPQFLTVPQITTSLNSKSIPPQLTASSVTNAENPSRPSSTAANTHVVKTGETPSVIARRYGVKTDTLMAANPRLDARRLRVGQLLNIPAH